MKSQLPKLGGHVSVAGGLYRAIENAEAIGAECIQIFGATPREWNAKIPSDGDIKKFKKYRKKSNVNAVYLHSAYLANISSPDEMIGFKSIKNLSDHLKIAEVIGANGLIFHLGSGKELPKDEAIQKAVEGMKEILKNVPGTMELVMENSAGGGQKLGATAKEMGILMKKMNSERIKICFDTANAFEAGIIENYTDDGVKKLFDEWNEEVGLENIVALHVNDSKTVFDSRHDKHENIGKGCIGLDGFKTLAKEKRLYRAVWILEVPGFDDKGPDKKNMEILRSCFE